MGSFSGFTDEGLALLRALPGLDKAAFQAQRAVYQTGLADPAKEFVASLGAELQHDVSPGLVAEPRTNGSIAPINNDVRFARGGEKPALYKDHLLFRFWEGAEKPTAPTLFVRVAPDGVGFATGAVFASVERWRESIDAKQSGARFDAAVKKVSRGRPVEIVGASLKRVPAPFGADHPRADWLRHKMLQIRWSEPLPKSAGSARFVGWCATRLRACADVHRWLVEHSL